MAELIYMYIENINRVIEKQSINFSNEFSVLYSDEKLLINSNKNFTNNFWSEKISSISLILGKNGSGKTSILDIIGFNEKTRKKHYPRSRYFLIYHVTANVFYYEGTIFDKISNIIGRFTNKSGFFFEFIDDQLAVVNNTHLHFTNIFYQRVISNVPWASDKYIYKDSHKYINKYAKNKVSSRDILDFMTDVELVHKRKAAVAISQKKTYTNTPNQLLGIYMLKKDHLSESVNFTNFYKAISNHGNPFIRSTQDNFFDKKEYAKEYFILRLLEKHFLYFIKLVSEKKKVREKEIAIIDFNNRYKTVKNFEEFQNELITNIINLRERNYNLIEFSNFYDLRSRIDFLSQVISNLQLNLKNNFLIKKEMKFNDLLKSLYDLPPEYFESKNDINFNFANDDFNKYKDFILAAFEEFQEVFKVSFKHFSDGELVYLNVFSNIYKIVKNSSEKNIILLLDEPDINLHPEWSRNFVNNLVSIINSEMRGGSIQIIITSHSPFMVTDFPKENIFAIRSDAKGNIDISNPKFGFAANLYDIVSDTFFMEYPIGQFAKLKLNSVSKNKVDEKEIEKVINIIDDNFLKNTFKNQMIIKKEQGEKY